jgi:hypothetical protein
MAQLPHLVSISGLPSGVAEIKSVAGRLNLVSPARAQGVGYEKLGLSMTHNVWIATRNMAYLIATILIIVAGFMVILRTRIAPQISVTIQMIIPRIAITLVLVTFSYAIAGFVIDLMYIVISTVLGLISFTQGVSGFTLISDLPMAIAQLTGGFDFVWHFLGVWIIISIILIIVAVIIAIAGAVVPSGGLWLILIGAIMGIFIWSVYVWARIVGQLIVAFILFNLLVMAGPIMIIFDILPSKNDFGGFKKWLSCLMGNASVFVMYALLAIIGELSFVTSNIAGFAETPRLFSDNPATFPLFTFPRTNFIFSFLIYMGFMTLVPNIVASVKNTFCKTADISDFIQNTLKDTVGQLTGAGQNINKSLDEAWKASGGQGQRPAYWRQPEPGTVGPATGNIDGGGI